MENMLDQILFTLISGFGMVLAGYIIKYVNTRIDEAQQNVKIAKYKKLNQYIDVAQDAITKAVTATSQTYVDDVKKAGNFGDAEKEQAKNKAIETARSMITEDSRKAIIEVYGDFSTYLDATVEKVVKEIK